MSIYLSHFYCKKKICQFKNFDGKVIQSVYEKCNYYSQKVYEFRDKHI
jgi:hypothetical protein